MTKETDEALKREMCYTEEVPPTCETCQFHKELESQHVDREWYSVCEFSRIGQMGVKKGGRCRFHSPAKKGLATIRVSF